MNAPHTTTRAASANHTERGAPRHEPFRYIYEERGTPDLAPGDSVIVIDPHSSYFEKTGVVDTVLTAKKYLIKFNWGACAIHPFKRSQLAKVERDFVRREADIDCPYGQRNQGAPSALLVIDMPKVKPMAARKRPDIFFCEWGKFDLEQCPEIPRRFMEHKTRQMKKKPITQPVICLPAVCESTRKEQARQKFEAFMQLCAVEYKQEEMFVESLDAPQKRSEPKTARKKPKKLRAPKPDYHEKGSNLKNRPNFAIKSQLRIRRYAA